MQVKAELLAVFDGRLQFAQGLQCRLVRVAGLQLANKALQGLQKAVMALLALVFSGQQMSLDIIDHLLQLLAVSCANAVTQGLQLLVQLWVEALGSQTAADQATFQQVGASLAVLFKTLIVIQQLAVFFFQRESEAGMVSASFAGTGLREESVR